MTRAASGVASWGRFVSGLSWKRLQVLCKGNQAMFLMEGKATLTRLRYELDEGVLHYGLSVHTKPRKATE